MFDYEDNKTPEIRMAPEVKPINPDHVPKRPKEEQPNMFSMDMEELIAFLISHLKMKVDMAKYDDPYDFRQTKSRVQKIDTAALRVFERAFLMHLVRDHGYGESILKAGE